MKKWENENKKAKVLNNLVTKCRYDMYSSDNYIFMSITDRPVKIIKKETNIFDCIVECSRCRKHVLYGTEIFMRSGRIYCEYCADSVDWK